MLAVGTIFCKLGLYWKQGFIKLRYVYRLQVGYFEGILNSCSFFLISSFLNRLSHGGVTHLHITAKGNASSIH